MSGAPNRNGRHWCSIHVCLHLDSKKRHSVFSTSPSHSGPSVQVLSQSGDRRHLKTHLVAREGLQCFGIDQRVEGSDKRSCRFFSRHQSSSVSPKEMMRVPGIMCAFHLSNEIWQLHVAIFAEVDAAAPSQRLTRRTMVVVGSCVEDGTNEPLLSLCRAFLTFR